MRVLAIIDHPWAGSFNHAILEAATSGLRAAGTGRGQRATC